MIRLAVLACLAAMAVPATRAETFPVGPVKVEVPTGKKYEDCFERAGGNDLDMAACESDEAAGWDRRMNAAWGKLRTSLPPAEMGRLQVAQRGWIAYRDYECRQKPDGGTMERVSAASCILRLTATRAAELEQRAATD